MPSPLHQRCARRVAAAGLACTLAACGTLDAPRAPAPSVPVVTLPAPAAPQTPAPATAAVVPRPRPAVPVPAPAPAVPRIEPLAPGAPNVPYEIRGQRYAPERGDVPLLQTGVASWYGRPFHGRRTANGEIYDMNAMTAAHKTMPLPSYALVRNPANGREVVVRVNDRGPFRNGRIIDLSRAAARKLGIDGIATVQVRRLTHEEIASGAWKQPGSTALLARGEATPPAP